MAFTQSMELDIAGEVDREALEEFISLLPADAKITTVASVVRGDRNMSDTYKVKLRAEWTVGARDGGRRINPPLSTPVRRGP